MKWVALPFASLALAACVFPRPPLQPDVVGVLEEFEDGPGRLGVFRLVGGQAVEIDFAEAELLRNSMGGGDPGSLLLAGEDARGQWYISLLELRHECYALYSFGTDAGASVVFDIGLQLPKSDNFDPGLARGGQYAGDPRSFFCINSTGEVVSYEG